MHGLSRATTFYGWVMQTNYQLVKQDVQTLTDASFIKVGLVINESIHSLCIEVFLYLIL